MGIPPLLTTAAPARPTFREGIRLLGDAQQAAADAINDPFGHGPKGSDKLLDGARDALRAARIFDGIKPKTPHHNLKDAAEWARRGGDYLQQAAEAYVQELPAPIAAENVRERADKAYYALELAFEAAGNW